ncbi:unnamed protein product [Nippostrongylus brasiliensis]|uniref:DDE_5 domain-containing protein n=1 Tax=Nippostrongylus brasiliensis TaxID=27835 RepID=A0A0N4YSU5_NIPBR|nr:unnamed protein product [Nippostrongylus brasiliensis]
MTLTGGEVRSSTLVPLGTHQLVWGELIADYRVPATGPGDRPADGETRHVIWLDDAKCNCECYGVRGNRRPLTEPGVRHLFLILQWCRPVSSVQWFHLKRIARRLRKALVEL